MTISFYRVNEPYGCFSNFSAHGFMLDGKWWPTSEHYFQVQKFSGTPYEERIRLTKKPMDAAVMGRDRNLPLRKDWELVKDDVMRKAVLQKFKSHEDIRTILLSTSDQLIVENTPVDNYWGCGKDEKGKTGLGKY